MAKTSSTWRVLPHGPLEQLSARVFRVEGDVPGMPLKRVMTVAKRADGKLVVHNAMALDEAAMASLDALGEVAVLVVPNAFHRLDAPLYHARYPKAVVCCPRGAKKKVEEVVPVGAVYEDLPRDEVVSLETLDGVVEREGVMIVREPEGTTLVFNDAIFNMPHLLGPKGFVLKHVMGSSGGPRVTRLFRLAALRDKRAFGAHLERLAALPGLCRVVVSHHQTIAQHPAEVLRSVAGSL